MTEGSPLERDRLTAKRDRLARFYRVVQYLEQHPDGARIEEIAHFVGVSRRTVYRDLHALEDELGIPLWSESSRWGVEGQAFLPSLKLTQPEAMAVVLAARLLARYADQFDPELAAAFQKLAEVLPDPLRGHVVRTLDLMAQRPRDDAYLGIVRALTRAWVDRRVVVFTYAPGDYGSRRRPRAARVRPYLIEPSAESHALYLIGFDEMRNAIRTFKLDRIASVSVTPERFDPPDAPIEESLVRAWGIIADQDETEIVLRFAPGVAGRVLEATWHPTQETSPEPDGSVLWRARVSGTLEIKLWILSWGADVEVLSPPAFRDEIASILRTAAARYGAHPGGPAGAWARS